MRVGMLLKIGATLTRQRYSRGHLTRSKTKPQQWLGEWHVYRTVGGIEKRVHRGPKLVLNDAGLPMPCAKFGKGEAQAALDRMILLDRGREDQRPAGPVTFGAAMAHYISVRRPDWSDSHAYNIEWLSKSYMKPLEDRPLRDLTRQELQECLNSLGEQQLSYSLIHKVRTLLKAVIDEAIEEDWIGKNVARKLKVPRTKAVCKRYLDDAEIKRLLSAATGEDHLILRLFIVCGLRAGELFALRRDDVMPGKLRIDESVWEGTVKEVKTTASEGYVFLPPSLELELRSWMDRTPNARPDAFLFPSLTGGPMRQKNWLRRDLKRITKRAGLEGVTLQSFRRTTATHLPKHGTVKDVQATLRHAKPDLTADVYMQAIDESVQKAISDWDDEVSGSVQ